MSDHLFETSVVELVKSKFDEPLVFGGFIGPGPVGLATMFGLRKRFFISGGI